MLDVILPIVCFALIGGLIYWVTKPMMDTVNKDLAKQAH